VKFLKLAEVDANELFAEENANWRFCRDNATFSQQDACEFILHVPGDAQHFEDNVDNMRSVECTEEFIEAYRNAKRAHADYVLFYV
jgi:hypothetical protein